MANAIGSLIGRLRPKTQKVFVGIWEDEHKLIEAARKTRAAGYKDAEAISPFPLHGIDEALGIPRSYIPYITFGFGLTGCLFGIWLTWWTSAQSWPLNIGGKPLWSLPAFVPIIFECTILLAALSSVGAMILINGLPKIDPVIIDPTLTSHRFALFVPTNAKGFDQGQLEKIFKDSGAKEVRVAEF